MKTRLVNVMMKTRLVNVMIMLKSRNTDPSNSDNGENAHLELRIVSNICTLRRQMGLTIVAPRTAVFEHQ